MTQHSFVTKRGRMSKDYRYAPVSVSLSREDYEEFRARARAQGLTMAALTRRLIMTYLEGEPMGEIKRAIRPLKAVLAEKPPKIGDLVEFRSERRLIGHPRRGFFKVLELEEVPEKEWPMERSKHRARLPDIGWVSTYYLKMGKDNANTPK